MKGASTIIDQRTENETYDDMITLTLVTSSTSPVSPLITTPLDYVLCPVKTRKVLVSNAHANAQHV
jgi:hypothetical protein